MNCLETDVPSDGRNVLDMTSMMRHSHLDVRLHWYCLALASLLMFPCTSFGNEGSYVCKDRDGNSLTGNGPPGNDCVSDICTFSNRIKRCSGDPTPGSEEESRNSQAEIAHKKWLSDIALLDRYPSEDRLEADRTTELKPVRKSIADAKHRLNVAVDQRKGELQDELDFFPHGNIPQDLAERLDMNSQAQEDAKKEIAEEERSERRIDAKYDDYLNRLRDLKRRRAH